jgi:hypothetical protein
MFSSGVRVLSLLLLTSCTLLFAQPDCSISTIVGTWAASSQGTVYVTTPERTEPMPVSGAAIGLVSVGYGGEVSVKLTGNIGGQVGEPRMEGTITVNSDCTGKLSAVAATGWKLAEDIVILDSGNEIWTTAVEGIQGRPAVWQCKWRRISPLPLPLFEAVSMCSLDMISGTWVGTYNGVVLVPDVPMPVASAIQTMGYINPGGVLSGKFTTSMGGDVAASTYAGSIVEVKPDCTGTWKWTIKGDNGADLPGEGVESFIILNEGKEIWTLTTKGVMGVPIGLGRYRQISRVSVH